MAPDGRLTQFAAVTATILVAVATAVGWDRVRVIAMRVIAVVACLATASMAGFVTVDRTFEFYGSWTDVLGLTASNQLAIPAKQAVDSAHSQIVPFTVTGTASHLDLPAYAYLPAGYAKETRKLPVVEALDGFPGSPRVWLRSLLAQQVLDQEIAAHRIPPMVVVFPTQTVTAQRDSECVDAVGGPAMDTFLTTDVPAAVEHRFRVRTDAAGWGLIGYSTGGFCAVNLALRHPDRYAAAASLSGYFSAITDRTTGDLYRGSPQTRLDNSPLWRVTSLPVPPLALYIATAQDDRPGYLQLRRFTDAARPPLRVTTATIPVGGHSRKVWRQMAAPAFDWLASWLAGPE
ncbi:MAG: esterase [Hamadaea sp.]|uniref:alpha/beta hydrolase n=1 Tax=Hamadaea sp. TaxID=2024425 RepID=UPI0017998442|nr:alpha/beta hydrolase-fold protein [Hamadaea sp.]NUR72184.1 esterase [Hamadaea sp.]NUT18601.1 esterase [Hamadaea sp.]